MHTADLKQRAALVSLLASVVLTLAKLGAGLASGSLALLSEAGHGALDTGATLLTFFAVRAADRPADDTHNYGHGKIEAVAALVETGLLTALAAGVLAFALLRLAGPQVAVEPTAFTFAVLGFSIVVDAVRWRSLASIARATRSDALAADALHFSSDLVASVLVALGLAAARFGFTQGDALAALGVALFIAVAGWRLGRRTIDTLVDAAPQGLAARVRAVVGGVPGVAAIESIRLRPAGAQILGDIDLGVPRTLPVERIAAIKRAVEDAVARAAPEVALTVTTSPLRLDTESVLEKVLLTAAYRRLPVHHITVQAIAGAPCVSLDVEMDAAMSHGAAHEAASALEAAIRDELGPGIEVETHIEPMEPSPIEGRDAAAQVTAALAQSLAVAAASGGVLTSVHAVRARQSAGGLVVNYHCRVDRGLSVAQVHRAVDAVDRRLRAQDPRVVRIVGHAEPAPLD